MKDRIDKKEVIIDEKALTHGAFCDLKKLLNTIKGRTTLMSNSVNPNNPLQNHFDEIIPVQEMAFDNLEQMYDIYNFLKVLICILQLRTFYKTIYIRVFNSQKYLAKISCTHHL